MSAEMGRALDADERAVSLDEGEPVIEGEAVETDV